MDIGSIVTSIIDAIRGIFSAGAFPPHTPERLMIGCIDARMEVSRFGFPHGSTLIKRNIAALVPKPEEDAGKEMAATLEFATKVKGVKEMVVIGHTDCGGIGACLHGMHSLPGVAHYLTPLQPVRQAVQNSGGNLELQARVMETAAVCMSLENLKRYPCVREAMQNGLKLRGWLLDVKTDKVYDIQQTEKGIALEPIPSAGLSEPVIRGIHGCKRG